VTSQALTQPIRPWTEAREGRLSQHNVEGQESRVKSPELVRKFVDSLPFLEIPARYVLFKPMAEVTSEERPASVVFLVDADRLAALVVLANYARETNDNVIVPYGAGCQSIGILTYREEQAEPPRAVVGLMDLSARRYIGSQLKPGLLSFSVPVVMYEEMEANVEGSFLERDTWRSLIGDNGQ
jgi:hypothetical protein